MTELGRVRAEEVPRSPALCALLARRLSPTWGFVAYGVLYLLLLPCWGFLLGCFGSVYLLSQLDPRPHPVVGAVVLIAAMLGGFALGWWPFVSWVRDRRGKGRRLAREGTLVTGTVTASASLRLRGAPLTRVTIEASTGELQARIHTSVGGHPAALARGRQVEVLVHPALELAGVFVDGRMAAANRK